MRVNLLKRLESSVDSFRITLTKFIKGIESVINSIEEFKATKNNKNSVSPEIDDFELDDEDEEQKEFMVGNKVKIHMGDMNTVGWKTDLELDLNIAKEILDEMEKVTPDKDKKLNDLKELIKNKIENPINPNNKKIIIFSAFADTVEYLYENLAGYNKRFNLETAKVTGKNQNKTTLKINNDFNNIITNFSPVSKQRKNKDAPQIDILISTDCLSEGQNLQDCDTLVNYDIHWNPVKIVQRFGRIDRIGSINKDIQLINFWPAISLDNYIRLKRRVETKMLIVDITATGDEHISEEETTGLSFREQQLKKLQEGIVDIEDMEAGISITDLGLNEFRIDLLNYIKNKKIDKLSNGMHTVCKKFPEKGIETGVIFVLKNINETVNIGNINRMHPFYIVYISEDGQILSDYLNVKNTLDILRFISKDEEKPIKELYENFNKETKDGKNMQKYSNLLNEAIKSIINIKEEKETESLFKSGGTTALTNNIKGLEDFELVTFVVIK